MRQPTKMGDYNKWMPSIPASEREKRDIPGNLFPGGAA